MVPKCGLDISLPEFSAWGLVGGGRASLPAFGNSGQREEELFSVDSGSIYGCELAQAAGRLWVEQAGC